MAIIATIPAMLFAWKNNGMKGKATAATNNPFKDTQNVEVLKAYNLGITAGVSEVKFDPNALLNREQAATMLTRTYKKATMEGWTLEKDSSFKLEFTKRNTFADR